MTVAEMSLRMSHREWVEQMIYDKLKREAEQEAALDRQLSATHRSLTHRLAAR